MTATTFFVRNEDFRLFIQYVLFVLKSYVFYEMYMAVVYKWFEMVDEGIRRRVGRT